MAKATRNTPTAPSREPVRFRGIPSSLTGIVPEGLREATEVGLTIRGMMNGEELLDVGVQADIDPRVLRVMLPAGVPPGTYTGELMVDGEARPAEVDVEAAPYLRVFPEQLRLTGQGGDVVTRSLTILNAGNVTIAIRKVQAFGVIRSGGIERALRRAYVSKTAVAERRIDIIAESLAEAHGGLVKMSVTEGAGDLSHGELRTIEVSVRLPATLTPGAEYGGNWELAGLVYPVTITVPGPASESGDPHHEQEDEPGEPEPPVVN